MSKPRRLPQIKLPPMPPGKDAQCYVCREYFADERALHAHRDVRLSSATKCVAPKTSKPAGRFDRIA
jgi:hypothetical protein